MRRTQTLAAILALTLALTAAVALIALPCFQMVQSGSASLGGVSEGPEVIRRQCRSLLEASGYRVLYLLLVPVFLAALYLLSALMRWKLAGTLLVFLLGVFVLITGFSIGIFFAPAALAATVSLAMLLSSSSNSANDVPQN